MSIGTDYSVRGGVSGASLKGCFGCHNHRILEAQRITKYGVVLDHRGGGLQPL